MMRLPQGMKITAEFFRDENGRLRCKVSPLGITKPVETSNGKKRYRWAKVFGLYNLFRREDYLKLQQAKEGNIIEVEVL